MVSHKIPAKRLTLIYTRFIAAEKPPHLKAIAPWEGISDFYRESISRGGIPNPAFWDILCKDINGLRLREDVCSMVENILCGTHIGTTRKQSLLTLTSLCMFWQAIRPSYIQKDPFEAGNTPLQSRSGNCDLES